MRRYKDFRFNAWGLGVLGLKIYGQMIMDGEEFVVVDVDRECLEGETGTLGNVIET